MCGNCGENVFQCHKCRSINYDEKDPFLCNVCGFFKYAKFDYALSCRPCCAVDPVESEDDRRKAIAAVNGLLDKADRVYKQLMGNKPQLEALLVKVVESSHDIDMSNQGTAGNASSGNQVNSFIQQLAAGRLDLGGDGVLLELIDLTLQVADEHRVDEGRTQREADAQRQEDGDDADDVVAEIDHGLRGRTGRREE